MSDVTLIRGRSYSVLGRIFIVNVPQEVRDVDAAGLVSNPSFRVTEPVEPVEPTREELKQALDTAGVEYNSRSKTETLKSLYDENCG